jgi:putative membrane protein
MGAADAVPGVSGGTIAFIAGIYQELINSLSRLGPAALKVLFNDGIKAAWLYINGSFLSVLLLGMLSSLIVLSNTVLYLLSHYPQILWGFFFGLICASTYVLAKSIEKWNVLAIIGFTVGTVVSYFLTTQSSSVIDTPSLLTVFLSGMLAICAMILPGISGSFVLLLLGMYSYILSAVKNIEILVLIVFATGCVAGLLSFSRLLNFLFNCHRNLTMALLTGFLLGSLNKVWPWKETMTTRLDRHGNEVADLQQNISPFAFEVITGLDSYLILSATFSIFGLLLVIALTKFSK